MDTLAVTHSASKINRSMSYMAYDAELNPEAAHIVSEWFRLAQKWARKNNRPLLCRSLGQLISRLYDNCEAEVV